MPRIKGGKHITVYSPHKITRIITRRVERNGANVYGARNITGKHASKYKIVETVETVKTVKTVKNKPKKYNPISFDYIFKYIKKYFNNDFNIQCITEVDRIVNYISSPKITFAFDKLQLYRYNEINDTINKLLEKFVVLVKKIEKIDQIDQYNEKVYNKYCIELLHDIKDVIDYLNLLEKLNSKYNMIRSVLSAENKRDVFYYYLVSTNNLNDKFKLYTRLHNLESIINMYTGFYKYNQIKLEKLLNIKGGYKVKNKFLPNI